MRILLIGFDPHDIGGTQNYTRPLALEFARLGHEVFYFYSGAWNLKYNWFIKPYLRIIKKDFSFACAELVNSPCWVYNCSFPRLDIKESQTEKLFIKYLKKIKPDVMHIHSRVGLPSSIIEIASRHGIKVFNSIHEYGFLCPKMVMIDKRGNACGGPSELETCAECAEAYNIKKIKLRARIENTNKNMPKLLGNIKRKLMRQCNVNNSTPFGDIKIPDYERKKIKKDLKERLDYMIHLINHHVVMNICVSTDVKRTFMKYGAKEERMLVQHIGSVIARNQRPDIRELHYPIVIGNIGGVGYYKGQHVLLDAISKMKNKNFEVKIYGQYEQDYMDKIMKGREKLPVKFLGRYGLENLPEILQQIDIMVLPSICSDTAPQTIFESYSAGIPIVASNIGGFPDFIKDGVNGYLFTPGDSQDLANKLSDLLSNPHKIKWFSSRIPRLKTITENALELISLYRGNSETK